MSEIKTHYDNLQVARNASPEVIRAAYKGLTQRYHPDRHPEDRPRHERIMRILNDAFAVLSDPGKRAEHDAWIARQEARAREASATNPPPAYDPSGAASAQPDVPEYYAEAAQAFRQSRVTSGEPEIPGQASGNARAVPRDESPRQSQVASEGVSQVPPAPSVEVVNETRSSRAAKGRRWALNTMKVFGVIVVVRLFFAFKSNQFKGLVEAVMLLVVGLVAAAFAFGLGWVSAEAKPVSRERVSAPSAAAASQPAATGKAGQDSSKWTLGDLFEAGFIILIVIGIIHSWITHS